MQIFHRSTNTISRVSVFGGVLFLGLMLWLFYDLEASPYTTQQNVARDQPVQFSHAHHAGAIGIDCRYCHTSVEKAAFAGIPPTKTCMNCHSQIWAQSPYLEPVRESFRTNQSIEWTRVHDLPDFVYFNHSIHVNRASAARPATGASTRCRSSGRRRGSRWRGASSAIATRRGSSVPGRKSSRWATSRPPTRRCSGRSWSGSTS